MVTLFESVTLYWIPQSVQMCLITENETNVVMVMHALIPFKDVIFVQIVVKIPRYGTYSRG